VGLADLVVDVVDTGRTLRENSLVEIDEIMSSEACLIVNRASHKLRLKEINHLMKQIAEVIGIRDQRSGTRNTSSPQTIRPKVEAR